MFSSKASPEDLVLGCQGAALPGCTGSATAEVRR